MSIVQDLLNKFKPGLKYEDLNYEERETLDKWLGHMNSKPLTIEDIKQNIRSLISAVEREMVAYDNDREKDLFLKAHLKCYLVIEAVLSGQDRARKAIEQYMSAQPKK